MRMCALSNAIREKPDQWWDIISVVSPLEDVPDAEKDRHSGSDNRVLDLVHPSLYPIVYGRTFVKVPQTGKCEILEPQDDLLPLAEIPVAPYGLCRHGGRHCHPRFAVYQQHPSAEERHAGVRRSSTAQTWYSVVGTCTRRPRLPIRTKSEGEGSLPEDDDPPPVLDNDERGCYADKSVLLSKRDMKLERSTTGTPAVSLKGTTIQRIITPRISC